MDIHTQVAELEDKFRVLVVLRLVGQIAQTLGVPSGAVKSNHWNDGIYTTLEVNLSCSLRNPELQQQTHRL